MQITISPHLQSTYKLIQNTFPKGIESQSYLPLLSLISEEMSSNEDVAKRGRELILPYHFLWMLNTVFAFL